MNSQRHLIASLSQIAGCIAGESQDSRSAHAPVSDEQRPVATQLGTWNVSLGIVCHQPLQGRQASIVNAQGEERGYRRFCLVAHVRQPTQSLPLGRTTRGDRYEVVAPDISSRLYLPSRMDVNMILACQRQKTVDNGMRILCLWEHTLVVLHHQGHPVAFEPLVGITMVKDMEEPFHQPVPTRIDSREVAYQTKRVGTVAASSATDFHLSQHMLAALKDVYLHLGHPFLQVHRQEETCSATSYYRCFHATKIRICMQKAKAKAYFIDKKAISATVAQMFALAVSGFMASERGRSAGLMHTTCEKPA